MSPKVTIAIATFNSTTLLGRVVESIRSQNYDPARIEILVVDGGSTDGTVEMAKSLGCRVLENPQTEPVNAKWIAFLQAEGRYLVYLDHDEVLDSRDNLKKKVELFLADERVYGVASSGYKNPPGYPFVNEYINEFGDPFSFFIYRISKNYRRFLRDMKRRFRGSVDYPPGAVFDLSGVKRLPLIELCAGGGAIDVDFFRTRCKPPIERKEQIPHFFYYMVESGGRLGITDGDSLVHYSADVLSKYFRKIEWRVKNNVFHSNTMGQSGFSGREKLSSVSGLKKFLFLPYVFLAVPVLLDSFYLMWSRRDVRYIVHAALSIWTGFAIVGYMTAKLLGYKPKLKSYDGQKVVKIEEQRS